MCHISGRLTCNSHQPAYGKFNQCARNTANGFCKDDGKFGSFPYCICPKNYQPYQFRNRFITCIPSKPKPCCPEGYSGDPNTNYQTCKENQCQCNNGVGTKGVNCKNDKEFTCQSCDEGYTLNKNTKTCQCNAGYFFNVTTNDCQLISCPCENGEGVTGLDCQNFENGENDCSECDEGFILQVNQTSFSSTANKTIKFCENYHSHLITKHNWVFVDNSSYSKSLYYKRVEFDNNIGAKDYLGGHITCKMHHPEAEPAAFHDLAELQGVWRTVELDSNTGTPINTGNHYWVGAYNFYKKDYDRETFYWINSLKSLTETIDVDVGVTTIKDDSKLKKENRCLYLDKIGIENHTYEDILKAQACSDPANIDGVICELRCKKEVKNFDDFENSIGVQKKYMSRFRDVETDHQETKFLKHAHYTENLNWPVFGEIGTTEIDSPKTRDIWDNFMICRALSSHAYPITERTYNEHLDIHNYYVEMRTNGSTAMFFNGYHNIEKVPNQHGEYRSFANGDFLNATWFTPNQGHDSNQRCPAFLLSHVQPGERIFVHADRHCTGLHTISCEIRVEKRPNYFPCPNCEIRSEFINNQNSCLMKTCICPNGTPNIGYYCPENGQVSCLECDSGYIFDEESNKCVVYLEKFKSKIEENSLWTLVRNDSSSNSFLFYSAKGASPANRQISNYQAQRDCKAKLHRSAELAQLLSVEEIEAAYNLERKRDNSLSHWIGLRYPFGETSNHQAIFTTDNATWSNSGLSLYQQRESLNLENKANFLPQNDVQSGKNLCVEINDLSPTGNLTKYQSSPLNFRTCEIDTYAEGVICEIRSENINPYIKKSDFKNIIMKNFINQKAIDNNVQFFDVDSDQEYTTYLKYMFLDDSASWLDQDVVNYRGKFAVDYQCKRLSPYARPASILTVKEMDAFKNILSTNFLTKSVLLNIHLGVKNSNKRNDYFDWSTGSTFLGDLWSGNEGRSGGEAYGYYQRGPGAIIDHAWNYNSNNMIIFCEIRGELIV